MSGTSGRSSETSPLVSGTSLQQTSFLQQKNRLVLIWSTGEIDLVDTSSAQRIGERIRLNEGVAWIVSSPDSSKLVAATRLPNYASKNDVARISDGFDARLIVVNSHNGQVLGRIRIEEAERHRADSHDWFAEFVDNNTLLVTKIWRENPARASYLAQCFLVDCSACTVTTKSDELRMSCNKMLLSPNRKLAILMWDNMKQRQSDGSLRGTTNLTNPWVIDLNTMKVLSTLDLALDDGGQDWEGSIRGASWCPDSLRALAIVKGRAAGRVTNTVRLVDVHTGKAGRVLAGHSDEILHCVFDTKGHHALTVSEDQTARLWDIETGKSVVFAGHKSGLNVPIFIRNDTIAVTTSEDGSAKLWDLQSGKLLRSLEHDSPVRGVESLGANRIRTIVAGRITTWDIETGAKLAVGQFNGNSPNRFGVLELVERDGIMHLQRFKE
jgi:WD40 repeat protein